MFVQFSAILHSKMFRNVMKLFMYMRVIVIFDLF